MNLKQKKILKEIIRSVVRETLKESVKGASAWGVGVPIGATDEGIYFLSMDNERNYFSMSGDILSPITEEIVKELEEDSVSFEGDYYWEEVFDYGSRLAWKLDWYDKVFNKAEETGNDEVEWNMLTSKQQEEAVDEMVDIIVSEKLESMSGEFDWEWQNKGETYYLESIAAGQLELSDLKYPIIPKKDLQILNSAWEKLHLKNPKDFDAGKLQLMKAAENVYENLYKNYDKLLQKSIQFFMLKGKKDKMLKNILKKLGYKTGKVSKNQLKSLDKLPLFRR